MIAVVRISGGEWILCKWHDDAWHRWCGVHHGWVDMSSAYAMSVRCRPYTFTNAVAARECAIALGYIQPGEACYICPEYPPRPTPMLPMRVSGI